MAEYPSISKGLGKLTPELWTRLMGMLRAYESGSIQSNSEQGIGGMFAGLHRPYFLAKITASSAIATNRYKYTYAEVVLDSSYSFTTRTGGRSGTDALNLCEMSNTSTHVGAGVDLEGGAYPTGFSMMPIGKCGDGDTVDLVVVMFGVRDANGVLRSVFSLANDHDGTCT